MLPLKNAVSVYESNRWFRQEETEPRQTGLMRSGENLPNCHRETNVTGSLLDSLLDSSKRALFVRLFEDFERFDRALRFNSLWLVRLRCATVYSCDLHDCRWNADAHDLT